MRKLIYLAKTSIIVETNAPIINREQRPAEVIITIHKNDTETVLKFDTDQVEQIIKTLKEVNLNAITFNNNL